MFSRIVLFLGLGLLLAGFGSVSWHYWQSMPGARQVTVAADTATSTRPTLVEAAPVVPADGTTPPVQSWLISNGGGLVSRASAQNFLAQHRFHETRVVRFRFLAPLSALLAPGEVLPDEVFQAAFAETRAFAVAARLCEPLLNTWADGCAIASAELAKDGYQPGTSAAYFDVIIAFTVKPEPFPLPDLGTRSFLTERLSLSDGDLNLNAASPEELLLSAVRVAEQSCSLLHGNGQNCRVMNMSLHWGSPENAEASMKIGALTALPKGVFPAPPL